MRTPTGPRRALILLVSAAALTASQPAHASTTVGMVPPIDTPVLIRCDPQAGVQVVSGGVPDYTFPSAGVITSFRHLANELPGRRIRLVVWRSAGAPGSFRVVGSSEVETLTPPYTNEFETRVAAEAGDLLGIVTLDQDSWCAFEALVGDFRSFSEGVDPPLGTMVFPPGSEAGSRLNIEATLEPDLDRDGYGDETQDGCPTDRTTQGPCPPVPETTITFRPRFRHHDHSRFRFVSSVPGSTFTCQMDRLPGVVCTSPIDYRRLRPGRHRFSVYAATPSAIDPTPATVSFKVRGRR